jgi:small subunit ribosomal protein S9
VIADDDTPTPDEAADAGEAPETGEQPSAETSGADLPEAQAEEEPVAEEPAEPTAEEAPEPAAEQAPEPAAEQAAAPAAEPAAEQAAAPEGAQEAPEPQPEPEQREPATQATAEDERDEDEAEEALRAKPVVPGAHLEVDIVREGEDPLGRGEQEEYVDTYAIEDEEQAAEAEAAEEPDARDELLSEPIATAAIDLAAGARYRATGKRKTAIARVTLRPGAGTYLVNGRTLEEHFPRATLQRNIRQPLETVGYHERMDVVARLHGGGISAQAGALRHGVSRALLEADPNLRGELKRRGFLTRDSRAKERKKAGLKKARKRPQFSKR